VLTSCLTGLESAVGQLIFFCFYFQNRLIQTSQTGVQRYSDTSPFSIPWLIPEKFSGDINFFLSFRPGAWMDEGGPPGPGNEGFEGFSNER